MSKREVGKTIREFNQSGKDIQSDQSTRWLAVNLSKIQTQMDPRKFNQNMSGVSANRPRIGTMLFFGYDPKTKSDLPFWDEFPLVIMIHKTQDSFLGLNLHYLSPNVRATFLNNLLRMATNPNYAKDPPALFKVTYAYLKSTAKMKPFKAAIKRYYFNCVKTKANVISSDEWKFVSFMPIERFRGAKREEIWQWANRYSK